MALVNHRNAVINPINGQQKFNVSQGEMTINFEISGAPNELLDLKSLRLNASFTMLQNNTHINNNNISGDGAYNNSGYISTDERIGLAACIQSIRIEDSQNNILEHIHNYPMMMAQVVPQTLNQSDLTTWCGSCYGIKSAAKKSIQLNVVNQTQHVSMKLYTGLTNTKPIPFAAVGGVLRITLTLNNPQSVLFGGSLVNAQDIGINSPVNNATYEVKNVKFNYKVIMTQGMAQMPKGGYVYRHFSNLQSTINSSSYQNLYTPNTSNTLAVMNQFISSDSLNNYGRNSYLVQKLTNGRDAQTNLDAFVDIKETQFKINGRNFPLIFSVDERVYVPNYDVLKAYYYISTIQPFTKIRHNLISSATEQYGGDEKEAHSPDRRPTAAGIGIRYDNLNTSEGINLRGGNNYLQRIDSGLLGNNPNEIMTTVYSFRKIVMQPSGPVIIN